MSKLAESMRAGRPTTADASVAVSVIVPVFNEEENVALLHQDVQTALRALDLAYEIVYVDDGSSDATFERLLVATGSDPRIRIVRLRRNFGQTAALQAGIEHSRGDTLVFMDGDLQNDPADIGRLLAKLDEGYDVVSGWRQHRQDSISRVITSRIANALISWVVGVKLKDYGCTLKAYRREVLQDVKLYGEMHRFIPAYAAAAGASVTEIPVTHHSRRFGRSKYGFSRTPRVLLDLLTVKFLGSYSTKPIYVFGFIGFVLWFLAGVCAIIVIVEKLVPPFVYAHRNPLLLLAVFLGTLGFQFIGMGLLAELIIRTYHESQGKPTYLVRQVVEGTASSELVERLPRQRVRRLSSGNVRDP
jgi:glycosyltransferase involved in cell wall biosynthesis